MSDRNPNFHNRRSIRLKGYDYSQSGLYFITLCVQNRERLFGEIRPVGEALCGRPEADPVEADFVETDFVGADPVGAILRDRPKNSDNISKGDHDSNNSKGDHAGSPQRMILNDPGKMIEKWYAEMENKYPNILCHERMVMPNHFHCIIEITNAVVPERDRPDEYGPGNKKYHPVIGNVVGWFKTMTTNAYIRGVKNRGWKRFDGKLWQRDYWEHIIRDEESYYRISNYIIQNPEKWDEDNLKN